MRLISFAGIDLPQPDANDEFQVNARSSLTSLKEGAYDNDGGAVYLRSTTFRRRVYVVGERIDEQMDTLNKAMLRGRALTRVELRDGRIRVTYGKISNILRPVNVETYEWQQAVTFTWSQDYPFWWDDGQFLFADDENSADTGLTADGNFISKVLTTSGLLTFALNYQGVARGTWLNFCLVPRSGGSLSNVVITNLTNGMSVVYNGTVAAEKRLDILCQEGKVYNASSDAIADFTIPNTRQMDWMAAEVGGNNFKITATVSGNSCDCYIQWADQFV